MNFLKLIADMLHLLAIVLLIFRIRKTRNCIGLSYRTQEMYLVWFILRYIDIFIYYVSLYNTLMKIFFVAATVYTIYLMRKKRPYCGTYDPVWDGFNHYLYIYPPVLIVTIFVHSSFTVVDFLWSYSLWLEAVAFIPQIVILNRMQTVENVTSHYIGTLGMYRFFYLINWGYRYFLNLHIFWTQVFSGVLQTVVYAELLYYYFKSIREGKPRMELPLKV